MLISKSIESSEGVVQFNGEISGPELDIVLQAGLLTLMRNGVIASVIINDPEETSEGQNLQ